MSLTPFTIIAAVDNEMGISRDGILPWDTKADMKFFRDITIKRPDPSAPKNVVIMGRKTYESIPPENRPLSDRLNIVISTTMIERNNPVMSVHKSLCDALKDPACISAHEKGSKVFIIGGAQIYEEAMNDFFYLCEKIILTRFICNYFCDLFFPKIDKIILSENLISSSKIFNRYTYTPKKDEKGRGNHQEYQYIDLLKDIYSNGVNMDDRTGVGTKSLFGKALKFDVSKEFPLITTKFVNFDHIIREMLWLLKGNTDTSLLEDQGIHYWKGNTTKEFLEKRGLKWKEKDQGPGYGHQIRRWGSEYKGASGTEVEGEFIEYHRNEGIDQFENLVENIKLDPYSRRHILNYWNVADIDKMCLPPCVIMCQFHCFKIFSVEKNNYEDKISITVTQRSFDSFLGGPYNIAMYAFLLYVVGYLTHRTPSIVTFSIGDAHLYSNHLEVASKQIKRIPFPFPQLKIVNAENVQKIEDFIPENFLLENYRSWQALRAKMAV